MDTVLYARDKYLVEGGLIFPDKCSIHLAGLEDSQYKNDKVNYWQDVYGFDYSPFIPLVLKEPIVDIVDGTVVNTTRSQLIEFDLNTVTIADLAFTCKFKVEAKRQDWINGVITWFDIEFPAPEGRKPITFSTGAHAPYTHWKQTVFYLADDLECEVGDILEGELVCIPNKNNNRDLDIKLSYNFKAKGVDGQRRSKKNENTYIMH